MSNFTDDLQRRLRAVFEAKTGKSAPEGVVLTVTSYGSGYSDLEIGALRYWEEPGKGIGAAEYPDGLDPERPPFERLLADLDAVPDEAQAGIRARDDVGSVHRSI